MMLEGVVTGGLGKGASFLALDYYKDQIKEKLDFVPYPGTFNISTLKNKTLILKTLSKIRIDGINKGGKIYGGANCYPAAIKGIPAAVIVPDLTIHNQDILEIIAPINLRSKLNLKDGDKIKIELGEN